MQPRKSLLETPITKADLAALHAGDIVDLSGIVYTARDAAHARIQKRLEKGETLPFDLKNQLIFYVGPSPAKPGQVIGSAAPTTSFRMDPYVEMMLQLGVIGMIGKGERSHEVAQLCRKYGAVYFLSFGGAAALIGKQIQSAEVIAYPDLGPESVKRLCVSNLRLIVGIDSFGKNFQEEEVKKYRVE